MKEEIYIESASPPAPSLAKRVSWGAIFAGLAAAMVIQIMLTLLGVAIGASTIDPLEERRPAAGLGMGAAIWLVASGAISLFGGAWVAGRLSGGPRRGDGLLHGVVTWSAATIATVLLAATVGGAALGGAGALVSQAFGSGPNAQSTQDPTKSSPAAHAMASVEQQVRAMFPQAGELLSPTGPTNQTAGALTDIAQRDPELMVGLTQMESKGGAAKAPAERDRVVGMLTSKHGIQQPQAVTMVNDWDRQFQQAKAEAGQKAREAGDQAAKAASAGAFWAFIALLVGGLVSAWGGWSGVASLGRARIDEAA